ncbi:proton-activated chloride channel isoform X4 [Lepidochelys kempii]|uniref:proton-activated chloride channel isoform X4 n=1 Tax=Lepidochelys kempii TaxID=8472 RepID=UPI003C6FE406
MLRQESAASYQELSEEVEHGAEHPEPVEEGEVDDDQEDTSSAILPVLDSESGTSSPSVRFSKTCLKNVFSVILLFIYLLLMAVAVFLVYQTITDFREKLKHPVMSVSYKEVPLYDAPGIALYPGKAQLLSCKHHYYDHIPPLINPGQPGEIECTTQRINYTDPFTNQTMKHALIVQGPRDVKKRELVFLQFHLNETDQDFSAINYLLFSSFQEFLNSPDKGEFMKDCESSYSSWKFSGGFRTWIKMSLVKTKEDGSETVEFKQEKARSAWKVRFVMEELIPVSDWPLRKFCLLHRLVWLTTLTRGISRQVTSCFLWYLNGKILLYRKFKILSLPILGT